LITGASSGFGRAATELLASKGWFVYAGARSQEDLDALNKLPNVKAIRLDVTRRTRSTLRPRWSRPKDAVSTAS